MSRTTCTLTMVGIAAAATALGYAAGLLFAPASGRETRRRLSRQFADERHDLRRACERALDRAVTAAKQEIDRRLSCKEDVQV